MELGETHYKDYDLEVGREDLIWGGSDSENALLPVGIATPHESDKVAHLYSNSMRTKLWLGAEDGKVMICFEELSDEYAGEWEEAGVNREVAYLEMHCPWPQTGKA